MLYIHAMSSQNIIESLFAIFVIGSICLINANVKLPRKDLLVGFHRENDNANANSQNAHHIHNKVAKPGRIIFQEDDDEPLLPKPTFPTHRWRNPSINIDNSEQGSLPKLNSGKKRISTTSRTAGNDKGTTPIPVVSATTLVRKKPTTIRIPIPEEIHNEVVAIRVVEPILHGSLYVPFMRQTNGTTKSSFKLNKRTQ